MEHLKTQKSGVAPTQSSKTSELSSVQKRSQLAKNLVITSPSLLENLPRQGTKRKATSTVSAAPKTPLQTSHKNNSTTEIFVPNTPEHLQGSSIRARQNSSLTNVQKETSPSILDNVRNDRSPVVAYTPSFSTPSQPELKFDLRNASMSESVVSPVIAQRRSVSLRDSNTRMSNISSTPQIQRILHPLLIYLPL